MFIIWDPRDWTGSSIQNLLRKDWRDKLNSCCVWHGSKVSAQNLPCIPRTNNFRRWVEYGLARLDRSVFYNAYAIWRENQGKAGANLQDSRYQFRSALLECTREFARRAMAAGITKRNRSKQSDRMRNIIPHQIFLEPSSKPIHVCENLQKKQEVSLFV